eukprot:scaffold31_cov334-Pavlova_lutheri.AAC.22
MGLSLSFSLVAHLEETRVGSVLTPTANRPLLHGNRIGVPFPLSIPFDWNRDRFRGDGSLRSISLGPGISTRSEVRVWDAPRHGATARVDQPRSHRRSHDAHRGMRIDAKTLENVQEPNRSKRTEEIASERHETRRSKDGKPADRRRTTPRMPHARHETTADDPCLLDRRKTGPLAHHGIRIHPVPTATSLRKTGPSTTTDTVAIGVS